MPFSMPLSKHSAAIVCLLTFTGLQTAQANLQVNFVESAPKDRFVIQNIGQCDLSNINVEIDLSNSVGKLYFDTTASGAGVEVFQPFEANDSNLQLVSASIVGDGDTSLTVQIGKLAADTKVSFTIDVDDALTDSRLGNIRVTGGELDGAQVRFKGALSGEVSAAFSVDNTATIMIADCA